MPKTAEIPDFLKPKPEPKQKPGPKAGVLSHKAPCPYCGENAHRKALQTIKGQGTFRRMYCASGCGHYHYRHPETNEVMKDVGRGPRVNPLFVKPADGSVSLAELEAELKKARQALKRKEREVKQAEPQGDWLFSLADTLGIDPGKLEFTSFPEGKPRAIVYGFSEADIAKLSRDDGETVEKLHIVLLTVQACIRAYKAKAK